MLHKVGAEKSTSGSATSAGAQRGERKPSGGKETFFTWLVIYMIEVLESDYN